MEVDHGMYDGRDLPEPTKVGSAGEDTVDVLRRIVECHQYECLWWDEEGMPETGIIVDAMTAQAMVAVADALDESPKNALQFQRMANAGVGTFGLLVEFAWKMLR